MPRRGSQGKGRKKEHSVSPADRVENQSTCLTTSSNLLARVREKRKKGRKEMAVHLLASPSFLSSLEGEDASPAREGGKKKKKKRERNSVAAA